ncbi:MAG: ATP-binding protein [Acidobacteriota bacterium]
MLFITTATASWPATPNSYSERVLILHSYHAGFPWTDEIQNGILSEFRRNEPNFEPYVEYLDWKRFPDKDNRETVYQSLLRKYAGKSFGVVIVSDNAALEFVLKYRHDIFMGATIVFCGVNGFSEAMIEGHDAVTGVLEDVDAAGTLEAALAILPGTKKVFFLVENTETGLAQIAEMEKAARAHEGKLELTVLDGPTLEEALVRCDGDAAPDAVLLLGSIGRDRSGRIFPDFAIDLLSTGCGIPVFVMWDFLMGKGATGGSVISGKLQGREAARMAMRLLDGEHSISVLKTPPTQLMFDNMQLQRFQIDISLLPKGSLLLNEPVTVYQRYRQLVPFALACMALMAGTIAALSISIIARRRVERELEKTRALLSAAFEHSPAGIMVAETPDASLTLANPAARRILGIPGGMEERLGYQRAQDFPWTAIKPDGSPYAVDELPLSQAALHGVSMENTEMRIRRPDGQDGWLLVSSSPVRDKSGRMIAGIVVFADITERKRMEDLVVQSEKMMSLGGLAAGMAHEINNPLGIIVHAAQNAQRRLTGALAANELAARQAGITLESLDRYIKERHVDVYIQDIMEAGHRAARIVRSMLNFSRPRQAHRAQVRMSSILEKALELVQGDFDLKTEYDLRKVTIERNYDPSDPSGYFDETEVVQVFLNIIKNAAQAMGTKQYGKDETPHIRLTTGVEDGLIRVDIEDNGPGMDETTCKRILEPFFTTKQVGQGTGLGLSVSYFIVTNSYGGSLLVDSEPARGTIFTVRLPRGRVGDHA